MQVDLIINLTSTTILKIKILFYLNAPRQERFLLGADQQGVKRPESTFYMPTTSDKTIQAFRKWFNSRGAGGPPWAKVNQTGGGSKGRPGLCVCVCLCVLQHAQYEVCGDFFLVVELICRGTRDTSSFSGRCARGSGGSCRLSCCHSGRL